MSVDKVLDELEQYAEDDFDTFCTPERIRVLFRVARAAQSISLRSARAIHPGSPVMEIWLDPAEWTALHESLAALAEVTDAPTVGWHCTTARKLARYEATGAILPPVRFWRWERRAREWAREKQRLVLLRIVVPDPAYPMTDHQPPGAAWWTPSLVRSWDVVQP